MFCPYKNSYLQLVCAVNPRVINKAVDRAKQSVRYDPHDEFPPARMLESMQPSLYAPHVDITRARIGFGRIGLRLINRDLHSEDALVQLQSLHSILDEVSKSESAIFLINLHVGYRLVDLMLHRNPIIKEKVCMILTRLAGYYQGRKQIMTRPVIIDNLMWLIMRERKEIRHAAAYTLRTLARDRCACETIMKNEKIIENLIKMIKNDHSGIVLHHLKTLNDLTEWDQVRSLKANAFQVMLTLFDNPDTRIVAGAMDCMTQLCKHDVGAKLADINDLTYKLLPFLSSAQAEVIISATGLMCYTTLTTRSKWRAKEFANELTKRLVTLCHAPNSPVLQLRAIQVLINLCDSPDIRNHMKVHWETQVIGIKVRTHEEWDGTTETTSYGLETGYHYRTMCIEGVETIRNDYGDNAECVNVHSYLRRIRNAQERLIAAINWKPYD